MTVPRLSCVFIGADTLLIECVDIALAQGHDVRAVVAGSPRVARAAAERGLLVLADTSGLASDLATACADRPFDYLFAITHLNLLPDEVLALPTRAAINFHDGPLPRYAGLNAPVWALMAGQRRYGISWHRMVSTIDAGPLLKQTTFDISPTETARSLNTSCLAAALETFPELLADLAMGRAVETPQDLSHRSTFGRFRRPAAACLIDWTWPTARIDAFVRALTFGPHANPIGLPHSRRGDGQGAPFIITELLGVAADHGHGAGAPGDVLDSSPQAVIVRCGDGSVAITQAMTMDGVVLSPGQLAMEASLSPGCRLVLPGSEAWQRLADVAPRLARAEPSWVRRLGALQPPEVVLARAGHEDDAHSGVGRLELRLPRAWRETLGDQALAATLAGLAIVLARTGRTDRMHLALVDPAAQAAAQGLEPWCVDRLPLEVALSPGQPFAAVVQAVYAELAWLADRGPFLRDLLLRHPALDGGRGLFTLPVGVVIDPQPATATPLPGTLLTLALSPDGAHATLLHDDAWLSPPDAQTFAQTLADTLSASLSAAATVPWTHLDLLSPETRRHVLETLHQAATPWPDDHTVHQLVEAQVQRTPNRVAVVCGDDSLSYYELDRRANRLAHALRQRGVGPDIPVGICVGRSLDVLVAMLGVLKAGGAYLPLDPEFPAERLAAMVDDSQARLLLTAGWAPALDADGLERLDLYADAAELADQPTTAPDALARPDHLAYLIYTSGSTGRPKGVMVEHRNVVSFFSAMDATIPRGDETSPGTWLAVTSLSFDISVLELLWTLTRGLTVVLYRDAARAARARPRSQPAPVGRRRMGFGLFMWGNDDGPGPQKYRLMLQAARYLDQHGFDAVWTPERHFHAFGGPFPNPSVTGAALAAVTERLAIRAGSCVAPLHHPIRIAEEWAVVDNLSGGRVGLAFAAGWQPNDFVIRPEAYGDHKALMFEQIDQVRRLWRGEAVAFAGPDGRPVSVTTQPRPVQAELPFWVTAAGNPETYRAAGAQGANLLTHLLGQTLDEVAGKIVVYRQARAEAGYDPNLGVVTLMLHTFVGMDTDVVKAQVRGPMKAYLAASMSLTVGFAWSFPAFKRPGGPGSSQADVDLATLTPEETDAILEFAFERYFETSGLFGTPETCGAMVERCKAAGVDELACLMDFGVDTDAVLQSLPLLVQVAQGSVVQGSDPQLLTSCQLQVSQGSDPQLLTSCEEANVVTHAGSEPSADSFSALVHRHHVTHLQCTPTMARMLLDDPQARHALSTIDHLMVGGEALSLPLAQALTETRADDAATLTNMFGPTETTIWSTTHRFGPRSAGLPASVPIGRPIANTRVYVLDANRQPLPPDVPGELYIAGPGVTRGYHGRPELTAERFPADPFNPAGGRMYNTGDLARLSPDDALHFLGRVDQQVKLRGHRIELGEIEACLSAHPAVKACVVDLDTAEPDAPRLIAWLVDRDPPATDGTLRDHARQTLPEVMVPARFVRLPELPQTPNGKVDRRALRALTPQTSAPPPPTTPPESELERTVAQAWQQTLGLDRVGVTDNFFDIGGHSLLVVQLHRRLTQTLDPPPSLVDLYRFPTVRALAQHLAASTADHAPPGGALSESADRGAKRRAARAGHRRS